MEFTKLKYKCPTCKVSLQRLVRIFNPKEFSTEGTKSVLLQNWCDKCKEPIALRYSFKETNEVIKAEVIGYLKSTDYILPRTGEEPSLTVKVKERSRGGR